MGKKPLSNLQYQDLIQTAMHHKNKDAFKVIRMIRYTGMHICVICDPKKYDLHTEKDSDGEYIVWNRPKKKGNTAYVSIKRSRHITFNVQRFIDDLKKRRFEHDKDPDSNGKRYRISRIYFYLLIRDVGEKAGLEKISPLSLRHTFGVLSIPVLGSDLTKQKLNCCDSTFKTYSKHSRETEKEIYEKANW